MRRIWILASTEHLDGVKYFPGAVALWTEISSLQGYSFHVLALHRWSVKSRIREWISMYEELGVQTKHTFLRFSLQTWQQRSNKTMVLKVASWSSAGCRSITDVAIFWQILSNVFFKSPPQKETFHLHLNKAKTEQNRRN